MSLVKLMKMEMVYVLRYIDMYRYARNTGPIVGYDVRVDLELYAERHVSYEFPDI